MASRYRVIVLAALGLAGVALPRARGAEAESGETLIVFHQPGKSELSAAFEENHLPEIRRAAREQGVALRLLDAAQGAPGEIAITPLLVFQNHRGRSIFQGRYASYDKVAHFVRTARAIPLGDAANPKSEIAVWRNGRAAIAAPIKITPLSGAAPPGHIEQGFTARAREAILSGFENFSAEASIDLRKTDRMFYMDFHPYRAEDGRGCVSMAVYSQFSCIEPVFTQFDTPVTTPPGATDQDWAEAFSRAARIVENAVVEQLKTSEIGDGFDPLDRATPEKTWEELGLALPAAPAADPSAAASAEGFALSSRWVIDESRAGDPPRLQFRFPDPLDSYFGEVADIRGELNLSEGLSLTGAAGYIEARAVSVTMGDEYFDQEIHEDIIFAMEHPVSRFELADLGGYDKPLRFGETAQFQARGAFQLVGQKLPVEVRAEIEPRISAEGAPQLGVVASFQIRLLETFGIMGPDGPSPQNDTMLFYLNFNMKPAE